MAFQNKAFQSFLSTALKDHAIACEIIQLNSIIKIALLSFSFKVKSFNKNTTW